MKLRFRDLYNKEHGAYPSNSLELVRYIENLLNQFCKVHGEHVHHDRLLEWVSSGRLSTLETPDRQQDTPAGSGSGMDGSCPTDAQTEMPVEQQVASGSYYRGCPPRRNVLDMQARRRFFMLWWIRKKRKHRAAAKMRRRIGLSVATEPPTSGAGAIGCGGMGGGSEKMIWSCTALPVLLCAY